MDLTILYIPLTKCCFLTISVRNSNTIKILKIWKLIQDTTAAARDVIYMVVVAMESN